MAGAAVALGAPSTEEIQNGNASQKAAISYYSGEIARFQKQTKHWQRVMGVSPVPTETRAVATMDARQIKQTAAVWRKRSDDVYRRALKPPHLRQFLCIHHYEGSWKDTGDPYWGGLQMDLGFQRTYGRYLFQSKGTADKWSPLEQIWAAEQALRSRGYWPWPNTARYCGLL